MGSTRRPSAQGLRVLDGGTGSELRRRGVALSAACWSAKANLTVPELLLEIHRDFVRAGADVVTTNTFATSRFVLAGAGFDDRFETINRAAIAAARRAAGEAQRKIEVAASLSCFPPAFDFRAYPARDVEYRAYCELAELYAENDVDLILLEMMQHPEHAALACRAAQSTDLPLWVGISCRVHPESGALVAFDDASQPLAEVIDAVLPYAPAGIAIMHSPVAAIAPALAELRRAWARPVPARLARPQVGHSYRSRQYHAACSDELWRLRQPDAGVQPRPPHADGRRLPADAQAQGGRRLGAPQ